MVIYNYRKEEDSQNNKYPENTHLLVETSSGYIYIVLNSDNSKIDKTTNNGQTWSNITDEDHDIQGMLYDRTNEYIYYIASWGTDSGFLKYIDLSDDSIHTVFSGGPLLGLGLGIVLYDLVEESDDDIHIFGTNTQHPADWEWGIVHLDFDYNQVETGLGGDPSADIAMSYTVNVSDDAYMLVHLTTDHVELWSADLALGGASRVEDIGANLNLPDSKNLRGISYDGSDTLYFVLKNTGDGKNYLYIHSITGGSSTLIGEYDVSLMLERNTDSSNDIPFNLEKGFDINNLHVYQILSNSKKIVKIADLDNNNDVDGSIVAITDTFMFIKRDDNSLEVWSYQTITDAITETLIYHNQRDAPEAIIDYRADRLYIEESMFIQVIGKITINGVLQDPGVKFEGYVTEVKNKYEGSDIIRTAKLLNPIVYDLERSYSGTFSAGDGDAWFDELDDEFKYGTKGTYDDGDLSLPETTKPTGKKNHKFMNQIASGELMTWRSRPTGEIDLTDGTDDSGVNYDQDDHLFEVYQSFRTEKPNSIIINGAYVNGVLIQSESDHGQNEDDQAINGIIEEEITIGWVTTVALANTFADNILTLLNSECEIIEFGVEDDVNGMLLPGEEITFAYSHLNISSDQYKISKIVNDDVNGYTTYRITSILDYDKNELRGEASEENAEHVGQVAETVDVIKEDGIESAGAWYLKTSGDSNDYLEFSTVSNIPITTIIGGYNWYVKSDYADLVAITLYDDSDHWMSLRYYKTNHYGSLYCKDIIRMNANADASDYLYFYTDTNIASLLPVEDKVHCLGSASLSFDHVYADDFDNTSPYKKFKDPIEDIKKIKGNVFEDSLDYDSLPDWVRSHSRNPNKHVRNSEGRIIKRAEKDMMEDKGYAINRMLLLIIQGLQTLIERVEDLET